MNPTKMRELVRKFAFEGNTFQEQIFGCALHSAIRYAPDDMVMMIVREELKQIEAAADLFTRHWNQINGE